MILSNYIYFNIIRNITVLSKLLKDIKNICSLHIAVLASFVFLIAKKKGTNVTKSSILFTVRFCLIYLIMKG